MKRLCLLIIAFVAIFSLTACEKSSFNGLGNVGDIFNEVEAGEVTFRSETFNSIKVFSQIYQEEERVVIDAERIMILPSNSVISMRYYITITEESDTIHITYTKNGIRDASSSAYDANATSNYCSSGDVGGITGLNIDEKYFIQTVYDDVDNYWKETYGYGIR